MGTISTVLTLTLLFQTTLASIQVYLGHSLGGLMYYLGERNVAVGSPGIALGSFMDRVVLRAYGTFSHPNILAGFAVVSLMIILRLRGLSSQVQSPVAKGSDLFPKRTLLKRNSRLQAEKGPVATGRRVLMGTIVLPILLTLILIFLTQSRSAAISLFIFIIPIYLLQNIKSRVVYFALLFFSLLTSHFCTSSTLVPEKCLQIHSNLGGSPISPSRSDLSLLQRFHLQEVSLSTIAHYPIFGTGAQSSIATYPTVSPQTRLLQPDHDSFTLLLSWFGLFGVLSLGSVLFQRRLPNRRPEQSSSRDAEGGRCLLKSTTIILPLLPLLLFDHYLLTSPQGLFILITYLIFAVNFSHA